VSNKPGKSKDPDIIASAAALRRAAKEALRIGLETGTPVWVMIDGRIVDLTKRSHSRTKLHRRAKTGRAKLPLSRSSTEA
jgi:hypothetical protein